MGNGKSNDFKVEWRAKDIIGDVEAYIHFADGVTCYVGKADAKKGRLNAKLGANYNCPNVSKTVTAGQYRVSVYTPDYPNDYAQGKDTSDGYITIKNTTSAAVPPTSNEEDEENEENESESNEQPRDTDHGGYKVTINKPASGNSVKAGAANALKVQASTVNIPNSAAVTIFLVYPDESRFKLRTGNVYTCQIGSGTCLVATGLKTINGLNTTIPKTTPPGSGYKVQVEVNVNGRVITDESDEFTVTQ